MTSKPRPGQRVKMSPKWVACTGGRPERFTVEACDCGLCNLGKHVRVDGTSGYGLPRHVAFDNLVAVK